MTVTYHNRDDILPDSIRNTLIHGGAENYRLAFLMTAERNFTNRFSDILRSLCLWHQEAHYPTAIKTTMLNRLSTALYHARFAALLSWEVLHSRSSPSAVIAPPINTV